MDKKQKELWDFVEGFCDNLKENFDQRWAQVTPDTYNKYTHHALGGLLARQATLAAELSRAPMSWNGHIAPLTLRCMVDAYITIAWMLEDPESRCEQYVKYGLGQEKLFIEHLKEGLGEEPDNYDAEQMEEMIRVREGWLNSQLADWAIDVDIGSWSGMNTRDMAKEIGRESIYKYSYRPFSGVAHNMWQHVGIYNFSNCAEPLHNNHLIPCVQEAPKDPDFLYRAAKYASITFELFDKKMETSVKCEDPVEYFLNHPFFDFEEE